MHCCDAYALSISSSCILFNVDLWTCLYMSVYAFQYTFLLSSLIRPFFQLHLWFYLHLHSQVVLGIFECTHATCCIVLMMCYFLCCTSQQVLVYSCVCMPMILWWVGAYAFTQCMKIVIVFPIIASSCSRTTQTKCCVAPLSPPTSLPVSLYRHKQRSPLGNRCYAHSLTEISRQKQAWPQGIREGENREDEVFSCGTLPHLFSRVVLITQCLMSLSSHCLFS